MAVSIFNFITKLRLELTLRNASNMPPVIFYQGYIVNKDFKKSVFIVACACKPHLLTLTTPVGILIHNFLVKTCAVVRHSSTSTNTQLFFKSLI